MRRAVTLLEALVVAAILAVLLALLLPAIQAARAAAARAACANHVRQLALACLSHATAHGRLPAGGLSCRTDDGWLTQIAPWCEAAPDSAAPAWLRCPARQPLPGRTVSDYVASGGAVPGQPCGPPFGRPTAPEAGAFRLAPAGWGRRLEEIADGTSRTLLLGEKRLCASAYGWPQPNANERWGSGWDWDAVAWSAQPPARDWRGGPSWWDDSLRRQEGARMGSAHARGLNAARCDGSVSFVSYSIAAPLWRALGTAAGHD